MEELLSEYPPFVSLTDPLMKMKRIKLKFIDPIAKTEVVQLVKPRMNQTYHLYENYMVQIRMDKMSKIQLN